MPYLDCCDINWLTLHGLGSQFINQVIGNFAIFHWIPRNSKMKTSQKIRVSLSLVCFPQSRYKTHLGVTITDFVRIRRPNLSCMAHAYNHSTQIQWLYNDHNFRHSSIIVTVRNTGDFDALNRTTVTLSPVSEVTGSL